MPIRPLNCAQQCWVEIVLPKRFSESQSLIRKYQGTAKNMVNGQQIQFPDGSHMMVDGGKFVRPFSEQAFRHLHTAWDEDQFVSGAFTPCPWGAGIAEFYGYMLDKYSHLNVYDLTYMQGAKKVPLYIISNIHYLLTDEDFPDSVGQEVAA